jgi:hypothetical protein
VTDGEARAGDVVLDLAGVSKPFGPVVALRAGSCA